MIKSILVAVWMCVLTISGLYVASFSAAETASDGGGLADQSEFNRTKMIAVPVLRDGGVIGYFLSRMEYAVDANATLHNLPIDPLLRHALHVAVKESQFADLKNLDEDNKANIERVVSQQVALHLGSQSPVVVRIVDTDFLLRSDS